MKYYIDTEFLEGKQKEDFPISLFRKETPNTIDLISIGIVAEDGREYYAISKDFNLKEAWNRYQMVGVSRQPTSPISYYEKEYWIRDNVILPIYFELCLKDGSISAKEYHNNTIVGIEDYKFVYKNLKRLINKYGKTNKEIAEEIKDFCSIKSIKSNNGNNYRTYIAETEETQNWLKREKALFKDTVHYNTPNEFYAYFADYNWVAFCWLFGKMINLPNGFPKYCKDLKQELDYIVDVMHLERPSISKEQCLRELKSLDYPHSNLKYPEKTNEHNALADAKWNKKLHEFILNFNNN